MISVRYVESLINARMEITCGFNDFPDVGCCYIWVTVDDVQEEVRGVVVLLYGVTCRWREMYNIKQAIQSNPMQAWTKLITQNIITSLPIGLITQSSLMNQFKRAQKGQLPNTSGPKAHLKPKENLLKWSALEKNYCPNLKIQQRRRLMVFPVLKSWNTNLLLVSYNVIPGKLNHLMEARYFIVKCVNAHKKYIII